MENGLFPSRKIQPMLQRDFVEARLHIDLTPEMKNWDRFHERVFAVRDRYLGKGNIGMPQFVVVEPDNLDVKLAEKRDGAAGGEKGFLDFFARAKARAAAGPGRRGN